MRTRDDQAAGLRRIAAPGGVKVIAVTSGKGGVGKTHVAVNLGIALAKRGRSTMLLDADLGLANVDVLLGLAPRASVEHVLDGRLELDDVVVEGPAGLKIVPAASGVPRLADLGPPQQAGLIHAFSSLPVGVDVMIVDTATGIGSGVTGFCAAANEIVVVVCDDPASIADAYASIKVMSRERGIKNFQVLCNRVRDDGHGRALFHNLASVCDRFLDVGLGHFGSIPEDPALHRAARLQRAVVDGFPSSRAGRAFKELAGRADRWGVSEASAGRPVFFLERLVGAQRKASAARAAAENGTAAAAAVD